MRAILFLVIVRNRLIMQMEMKNSCSFNWYIVADVCYLLIFLWPGWICLINNLLIDYIFISFTDIACKLWQAWYSAGLQPMSARLQVQANGANHYCFSFRKVTGKWQEHTNTVDQNTICEWLWCLMVLTVRLDKVLGAATSQSRSQAKCPTSQSCLRDICLRSHLCLQDLVHIPAYLNK